MVAGLQNLYIQKSNYLGLKFTDVLILHVWGSRIMQSFAVRLSAYYESGFFRYRGRISLKLCWKSSVTGNDLQDTRILIACKPCSILLQSVWSWQSLCSAETIVDCWFYLHLVYESLPVNTMHLYLQGRSFMDAASYYHYYIFAA